MVSGQVVENKTNLWRLQEAVVFPVLGDLLGVQQDGPAVHQHLVRLVHGRQDVVGVFTAVAGAPAQDPGQVVPWGDGPAGVSRLKTNNQVFL